MRGAGWIVAGVGVVISLAGGSVWAQEAAPQTARQALIEMFTSQAPGALEKHLPEATLAALRKAQGGALPMSEFAGFAHDLSRGGKKLETFDTGSTLLTSEDPRMQRKVEVTVERDDLRGDEEQFDLGIQSWLQGKPETLPIIPTITMIMKQEKNVWKLNEVSFTARVPLGDPEYLKGLTKQVDEAQAKANEASAVANLRTLLTAEITYRTSYPGIGFTCTLPELGGAGKPLGPKAAHLVDEQLASGQRDGYLFAVSGCTSSPAAAVRLMSMPARPGSSRMFCSDESGVIRASDARGGADCWRDGKPLE